MYHNILFKTLAGGLFKCASLSWKPTVTYEEREDISLNYFMQG